MTKKQKTLTLAQVMRGETWPSTHDEFTSNEYDVTGMLVAFEQVEDGGYEPMPLEGHGIILPC